MEEITARCMKCKKQIEIKDREEVIAKNNMRHARGVCPECGTKVCRILRKASDEEVLKENGGSVEVGQTTNNEVETNGSW